MLLLRSSCRVSGVSDPYRARPNTAPLRAPFQRSHPAPAFGNAHGEECGEEPNERHSAHSLEEASTERVESQDRDDVVGRRAMPRS
jgi:hypothetical protein